MMEWDIQPIILKDDVWAPSATTTSYIQWAQPETQTQNFGWGQNSITTETANNWGDQTTILNPIKHAGVAHRNDKLKNQKPQSPKINKVLLK